MPDVALKPMSIWTSGLLTRVSFVALARMKCYFKACCTLTNKLLWKGRGGSYRTVAHCLLSCFHPAVLSCEYKVGPAENPARGWPLLSILQILHHLELKHWKNKIKTANTKRSISFRSQILELGKIKISLENFGLSASKSWQKKFTAFKWQDV